MDVPSRSRRHRVPALLVGSRIAHDAQHVFERHLALAYSLKRLLCRLRLRAGLSTRTCSFTASGH